MSDRSIGQVESFRQRRAGWIRLGCYASSSMLLIGVWQALGNRFGVLFAPFSKTMRALADIALSGDLAEALLVSGKLYLVSLALCIVVGLGLGLALARFRLLSAAIEPYLFVLYASPTISLIPFIQASLGFGFWAKCLVTVLISIFPVLLTSAEGARAMPRQYLDVAAVFGSNERQLWRDVILPFVTPYAMTGIKQTIALTMAGTLVGEFFLSPDGVAALLLQGTTSLDTASVLAVTVTIALLALGLIGLGALIEGHFAKWRQSSSHP